MARVVQHEYERRGLCFITKAKLSEKDWYEWSIEIARPEASLKKIKEVEYILHPTFKKRVRRFSDPDENFKLDSEGWGEFDITVNLYFKNGDEQTVIVPLKLE